MKTAGDATFALVYFSTVAMKDDKLVGGRIMSPSKLGGDPVSGKTLSGGGVIGISHTPLSRRFTHTLPHAAEQQMLFAWQSWWASQWRLHRYHLGLLLHALISAGPCVIEKGRDQVGE